MPNYCLDANVLIEAKNGPYGFDIVPGFWEWLDRMASQNEICSVRAVYDEIVAGDDVLTSWAKQMRNSGFFIEPNAEVQAELQNIANHVFNNYEPQHAQPFLNSADPWVIAQAKVFQAFVDTREALAGPGTKRVKIPNICFQFGVEYMDTYAMLRREGARFQ